VASVFDLHVRDNFKLRLQLAGGLSQMPQTWKCIPPIRFAILHFYCLPMLTAFDYIYSWALPRRNARIAFLFLVEQRPAKTRQNCRG